MSGAVAGLSATSGRGGHDGAGAATWPRSAVRQLAEGIIAGQAVEQHATQRRGVEVTVKLDNGTMVAVTQEADETFRPGDRVRLLSDGATTRVTR